METPEISVARATLRDAIELSEAVRAEDLAELIATDFDNALDGLSDCLGKSAEAYALRFDGEVAAMWGAVIHEDSDFLGESAALVWLITGQAVLKRPMTFFRIYRSAIRELLKRYTVLFNLVDSRYDAALRMLKRAGFIVKENFDSFDGVPFHLAAIGRPRPWAG